MGLKADGTVVAAGCGGENNAGQCDVGGWNLKVQDTTTTTIKECTYGSCETTPDCTAALGPGWICRNGCCENVVCPASLALEGDKAQLDAIRHFRDEVLSQTPEGQEIIKLYYQWSPVIVQAMEEDEEFKEELKEMIDGIVVLITEEVK